MKLLFAIAAADKISATYLNDADETLHADLAICPQVSVLRIALDPVVGQSLRGVQIFTEHAGERAAHTVEGLYATPAEDGTSSKLVCTLDADGTPIAELEALQTANAALRAAVEAGLAAL